MNNILPTPELSPCPLPVNLTKKLPSMPTMPANILSWTRAYQNYPIAIFRDRLCNFFFW